MNKKTVFLLTGFVIIILFAFSGCTGKENSEIVGSWVPATAKIGGTTVNYSTLELEDGKFALEFFENGKCVITLAGIDNDGTYTFNGTSVDIITGKDERKLDYSNGTLTLNLEYDNNNSMQLTFTKTK